MGFTLDLCLCGNPIGYIIWIDNCTGSQLAASTLKGLMVFFSLLPMIVTPLVGSLILFWMIDARGIIGSGLQELFADPICH